MSRDPVSRRSLLHRVAASAALSFNASLVRALAVPGLPTQLHILCAAPPGGTPDLIARSYAEGLGPAHPDGVIVENRPGAAGRIAIAALRQASPDGATMLLLHGTALTVYPHLYLRLDYDPQRDLAPVSLAADTAFGLAVGPLVPQQQVRRLDDFIGWARAHPSQCNYGSPGLGTLAHLIGAMLFRAEAINAQHVPYAGGPPAIGDALGGRLAALVLPEGLLRSHHAAGLLRILASTAERRSPFLPDVPSFAEQGLPALSAREWFGFFMPAGTPPALTERMSLAVQAAGQAPRLQAVLAESALRVAGANPQAMALRIAAERLDWREPTRALDLQLE